MRSKRKGEWGREKKRKEHRNAEEKEQKEKKKKVDLPGSHGRAG